MRPGAGRAVLVTGCSSGIGRCAARVLRERGYRVVASARGERDVAALAAEGFAALRIDLAAEASVLAGAEAALELAGGTLYGLFNNGAYGQPGALEDLPAAALREQLETNLVGWHALTRAVIPAMRRAGAGRIVQNSSILGLVALKYRGAYNASKFALEGLTDTLRLELAGSGIAVSLIEPGPIATRFSANALAALRRHVDRERSVHREAYRALEARLEGGSGPTPFTLPPEAVVAKLVHALESRRPRARYPVTVPTHAFTVLRRLLPTGWLDRLLAAAS